MSANNLKLMAIPQLMGKHFFIPDYQRGYRWEKEQVYALLKDLWHYSHSGKQNEFYCLQPIVVKECTQETIENYKLPDFSSLPEYDSNQDIEDLRNDISFDEGAIDDDCRSDWALKSPKNNVWYEVIDGQQRLTTIRILLEFNKVRNFINDQPFVMRYATRAGLHEIFKNLQIDIAGKKVSINSAFQNPGYVDVEYIHDCANNIIKWFNDDTIITTNKYNELGTFLTDFYMDQSKPKSVRVIWYETFEQTDARDIFERLNDLQVPLSSSELIRALFLSKNAVYDSNELNPAIPPNAKALILKDKEAKQSSINAKWDEIEHFFRNDDVWAFITNKEASDYRNRIELLFDLMSKKDLQGLDDRLYTYIWFENKVEKKNQNLWDLWQDIVKCFDTIRFWYENKNYYHKIGFLIHETDGTKAIPDLLEYSNSGKHKKSDFDKHLLEEIKSVIQKTGEIKLSELSYETKSHYRKLKSVLLLYNIELTNQSPVIEAKFPFKDYKAQEGKDENGKQRCGWTLEHIHAQDSECLDPSNRKEWINWARFTLEARKNVMNPTHGDTVFMHKLQNLLTTIPSTGKCLMEDENKFQYSRDLVPLFQEDLNLWSGGCPFIIEHQLQNLALLSGEINSSIGKGSFSVKQQCINKCIADGKYVPIATQKVFLKHYYPKSNPDQALLLRQLLTWEKDDRTNYLKSITEVLSQYGFDF